MHPIFTRLVLAASLLTAAASSTFAQAPKITYSPAFDEPRGIGQVLHQTRNGSTLLFNFTKKEGIEVTTFNSDGRKTGMRVIKPKELKEDRLNRGSVLATFDVGPNTALFVEQLNLMTPELFRVLVNSETGALVEEKKIAEMSKYGALAGYVMAYGDVDPKSFFVQADPASGCYAVVSYDDFGGKESKRLRVQHFDSTNTLINDANCEPPAEDYKLTRYIAMHVDGARGLLMALYCSEGRAKSDPSKVFVSRLVTGSKEFEHYPLQGYEDPQTTQGLMRYNPVTGRVMLLTLTRERSKGSTTYYSLMLSAIDPKDPSRVGTKQLSSSSIKPYKRSKKGSAKPYGGLPQDMLVHPDGSVTIPFEAITTVTTTGRTNYTTSSLGDIGLVRVGADGAEAPGSVIRRQESAMGAAQFLSHHTWDAGQTSLSLRPMFVTDAGLGFYEFDYFNVGETGYVVLNSHPDNGERSVEEEPKSISSYGRAEGILYTIKDGDIKRARLFGGEVEDRSNKVMYVRCSHFNPVNNRYAVLIHSPWGEKGDKWKVAWLNF